MQFLRCHRCGGSAGPNCRCFEADYQSQPNKIDLNSLLKSHKNSWDKKSLSNSCSICDGTGKSGSFCLDCLSCNGSGLNKLV